MSRRRWVYTEAGRPLPEPVEVPLDWSQPLQGGHKSEAEVYGSLQATDGTDISTRRRHREYMRRNGLTLADDYREHWAKAREQRAAWYTGEGTHEQNQERREDIGRVVHQLEKRRR